MDMHDSVDWGVRLPDSPPQPVKLTRAVLLAFLNEYPEQAHDEIQIQDEDGVILEVHALEWANGPWIVVESSYDKVPRDG